MPIEGPLRELGIHDVFQLLDLSRKTGILRVTSDLRGDEGMVYFESGRVVHGSIRSKPQPTEEVLVAAGKITPAELERARALVAEHGSEANLTDMFIQAGVVSERDLERLLKQRLEGIVFDLMSWREGFFSFEERAITEVPAGARVTIATESLLMEGARRIDEWSRIADKVPSLAVIPALAPLSEDHESQLDLLPHEWEVLTMIDGSRDLRAIASALGTGEFDVAKVAYGLATTGVIEIHNPRRLSASILPPDPVQHPAIARARSLATGGRTADAIAELHKAAQDSPTTAELFLEIGYLSVRGGDLDGARVAWERFLKLSPADAAAAHVRAALDAAGKLLSALEAHGHG